MLNAKLLNKKFRKKSISVATVIDTWVNTGFEMTTQTNKQETEAQSGVLVSIWSSEREEVG